MIITDFYVKYKDMILPSDNFYPRLPINTEYIDDSISVIFDKMVNCDGKEFNYLRKIIIGRNIYVNIRS